MKSLKYIFLFILLSFFFEVAAQINSANKKFESKEYAEAIRLYKKVLRKNNTNIQALENIAASYRLLRDYKNAEEYYAKALQQADKSAISHFYYAEMLKHNGKYAEAKEQYLKYASAVSNDKTVEIKIRSLAELKEIIEQPPLFKLKTVTGINTRDEEYAPVYYKDGIIYVSNRMNDLVYFETNSLNNKPYNDVWYAPINKASDSISVVFDKYENFSSKINSVFHDGPATFNADYSFMFFERVEAEKSRDKKFVNTAKIYYSTNVYGTWSKPQPFIHNSDTYSLGHPSLSPDGQKLFFASDMPGGFGGKDIYVCIKEDEIWGKPQNLGPEINTPGDELFPYIRKDGTLFFSSDDHAGLGGLDIYMSEYKKGKYSSPFNLGAPINSIYDDMGIVFDEENKLGFFSSGRNAGQADDVFAFESTGSFVSFDGKILLSRNPDDPLKNSKIFLYKEDGTILKVSSTDTLGFFSFRNLPSNQKYMVGLDEEDPKLEGKHKVYMADEDNRVVSVVVINKEGKMFRFTSLPPETKKLPFLQEEDVAFSGKLFLNGDTSKPLVNTKINLYDEKGNLIETVTTDEQGVFVFKALPPDKNYSIRVDAAEDTWLAGNKITLANNEGGVIAENIAEKSTYAFGYKLLPADIVKMPYVQAEDYSIAGNLTFGANGDKPLANTKVVMYDENGNIIETVITDEFGKFVFKPLPPGKKYSLKIEDVDDAKLGGSPIVIKNKEGSVLSKVFKNAQGTFEYKMLPADAKKMRYEKVDDDVSIAGNLTFGANGDKPLANTKVVLYDENGNIIETVTTDEFGKFVFKPLPPGKKYSLKIEDVDDAKLGGSPIVIKNKEGSVLSKVSKNEQGTFEYKMLPGDAKKMRYEKVDDDVSIAGSFMYGDNGTRPLSNIKVGIYNDRGELVGTATTNELGAFVFTSLPPGNNYKIKVITEDDPRLADTKLTMKNKNGDVMSASNVKQGKGFEYVMLASDKKSMNMMLVEDTELSQIIEGRVLDENKKPIEALLVRLVGDKGKVITAASTDKEGRFLFKNLPEGKNYIFEIDETDSRLTAMVKILITDSRNNIIREITKDTKGKYSFRLLPSEQKVLVTSYVDDPMLTIIKFIDKSKVAGDYKKASGNEKAVIKVENNSLVIIENILYPPDEVEIFGAANIKIMKDIIAIMSKDKSLRLEIGSFTDSKQSNEYNQILSDKRAKFAVDYIVSRGIAKSRVVGKGYGESQLLNGCIDGVECSEAEHAVNRRTEFKFSKR